MKIIVSTDRIQAIQSQNLAYNHRTDEWDANGRVSAQQFYTMATGFDDALEALTDADLQALPSTLEVDAQDINQFLSENGIEL